MSENSNELGEKLQAAGELVVKQKAERQARVVKGAHLLDTLKERVAAEGLTAEVKSGFTKVTAPGTKGRVLYIANKGGRVDLSGFTLEHAALTQISADEAKAKHLGKVRAQINFESSDADVLAAFSAALVELKAASPATVKEEKVAETSAETPAAPAETPAPEQA